MSPNLEHSPIWDTDLTKPPSVLIEEIRCKLSNVRGNIKDLMRAYPSWTERLDFAEGGITCVIAALHASQQEFDQHQAKWGWSYKDKV